MTTKYVGPEAVEAVYRERLAHLEVMALRARLARDVAEAALGNAEAELSALETEFRVWQAQGDAGE